MNHYTGHPVGTNKRHEAHFKLHMHRWVNDEPQRNLAFNPEKTRSVYIRWLSIQLTAKSKDQTLTVLVSGMGRPLMSLAISTDAGMPYLARRRALT